MTDYSKPIVTISMPDGVSFTGLNIYADQIVMHSQSLREDSVQSLHTFEGKRTRFTLTILPMAYGNPDFNLCILYINGVKNREFAYEDNDYFAQRGGIVIGSDCRCGYIRNPGIRFRPDIAGCVDELYQLVIRFGRKGPCPAV